MRKCFSTCKFFRCGQKMMQFRSGKVYCLFADDICEGATCKYASCIRGKLLANGLCGLTVRRTKVLETTPEEVVEGVKVRGKLQQRLREREIF